MSPRENIAGSAHPPQSAIQPDIAGFPESPDSAGVAWGQIFGLGHLPAASGAEPRRFDPSEQAHGEFGLAGWTRAGWQDRRGETA